MTRQHFFCRYPRLRVYPGARRLGLMVGFCFLIGCDVPPPPSGVAPEVSRGETEQSPALPHQDPPRADLLPGPPRAAVSPWLPSGTRGAEEQAVLPPPDEPVTWQMWTNRRGDRIQAAYVERVDELVVLRTPDAQLIRVPLAHLDAESAKRVPHGDADRDDANKEE